MTPGHADVTPTFNPARSVARMAAPTLLAISHGTSSPVGATAVATLVDAVAARLEDEVPVRAGFVDVQEPDVPTCLDGLRGRTVIVPLLLSAGFHVHVDLRREIDDAVGSGADVALAGALGPDGRLVDLLARRLAGAGLAAGDVVVLAAAGSSDARAVADCERTGALLAERTGHPVSVGFIANATPRVPDVVARARTEHPGARVVIASYLLAPGYFQTLAERAGADVTTGPLLLADAEAPRELVDIVIERYRVTV